jgi:hypothetical protein
MSGLMRRHSPSETGGILVGRIAATRKTIYVTRLVSAPPDSAALLRHATAIPDSRVFFPWCHHIAPSRLRRIGRSNWLPRLAADHFRSSRKAARTRFDVLVMFLYRNERPIRKLAHAAPKEMKKLAAGGSPTAL